ncbi:uncharacterized protein sertad2a isoform 1-T2 [Synchiropus picturatus]
MSTLRAKRKRTDGAHEPDGGDNGDVELSSDSVWVEDYGGCVEIQCEDDSLEDGETAEAMVARQRQALLDVSLLKLYRPPQRSELGLQRHILISSVIRRIHDDIRQEAGVMYVVQASPADPSSYYLVPALLLEEPPESEDSAAPMCLTTDGPPVENTETASSTSPSLYDDVAQVGWSSLDPSLVYPERCRSPPPCALMTDYVLDDVLPGDASLYDPLHATKHAAALQQATRLRTPPGGHAGGAGSAVTPR